jgi:hypothetical protein
VDFLVVPMIRFAIPYVFVVLAHDRRAHSPLRYNGTSDCGVDRPATS